MISIQRFLARIIREPIEIDRLAQFVSSDAHGALASFCGVVRDHDEGRRVTGVSYDAFEPLAGQILAKIAQEAAEQWSAKIAVVHRLGDLNVGETSVAIATGSPHREEAFAACRYVIEQIKVRLPVWKKEHYVDGASAWLEGHALCGKNDLEAKGRVGRS